MPTSIAQLDLASLGEDLKEVGSFFAQALDNPVGVYDESGVLLCASDGFPEGCDATRGPVVQVVAGKSAQLIAEEDHAVLLAIPAESAEDRFVILVCLATREYQSGDRLEGTAELLGLSAGETVRWLNHQALWTPHAAECMGAAVQQLWMQATRADSLKQEVQTISDHLGTTYEEISLLYSVTQNLRISSSDDELAKLVLEWLRECLPACGLAIYLLPIGADVDVDSTYRVRTGTCLLNQGDSPVDETEFRRMIEVLGLSRIDRPYVANGIATSAPDWMFPDIRQVIVVQLSEGENVFGYLAAFNHVEDGEFGTVEATLLGSVAAILGIHAGNRDLYRQQAEFLATVVRALTSAIDAKDPYTCGHSDRVARVAVRLARQLGWNPVQLNTIYMSGLLHDIGKIGIDDQVLRKPGRLTDEEFEHIKLHPELGYKILADIKPLADVIPAVLHHHEQWDGHGYPQGLQGDEIPSIARIIAVADAFDAMSSDRPYRAGMPEDKVDIIFRGGAGQQWDPEVINAFFAARQDIREITQRERANLSLDVQQWAGRLEDETTGRREDGRRLTDDEHPDSQ